MIVIDASAMVEALIGRNVDDALLDALTGEIAAPHILDVEVLAVLRGLARGGKLQADRARAARANHFDLDIKRYDAPPLAERIWSLRRRYTSYDAAYIALSEALSAPLHTCDGKLAAGGHHAVVHVHTGGH